MDRRSWDSRLARRLVLPLRDTWVHPNHVTTAGLLTGCVAAAAYATGTHASWGAALYGLSAILDHADGELARATGRTSAFGRAYDRFSDLSIKVLVFAGMGIGLRHGGLGLLGPASGIAAGVAFVAIFLMRNAIARRRGWDALAQPSAGGFEIEDVLYVALPVTWLGLLAPFCVAAGVGAPTFALWVAREYRGGAEQHPRAATNLDRPGATE
ncbi:MAG: CDP-alcohol phosphatidyltransferase family protein [Candidatus Binatia bacterium]